MWFVKTFLVVLIIHSVISEESLLQPCQKDDIACLTSAAQNFLEKSSAGVPQYDIKPIDPMPIDHIEITLDSGTTVHFKNVTVTGLKKLLIHDFKIDTSKKSVVLAMEDDPEIVADIEVEKKDKSLYGKFSAKGKVLPTAKYNYDLVTNDKGVEYFSVGPETLTCEVQGAPQITVSDEISNELWKDNATSEEAKKTVMCSVINPAFHTVIHNLRASARIFPKTAYFTDL